MKSILAFLCVLSTLVLSGQSEPTQFTTQKRLTLSFGISNTSIKDKRIGNSAFNAWSPKYGISYTRIKTKSRSHIQFQFTSIRPDRHKLLSMTSIRPDVNFAYERKVKEGFWIGGFSKHHTILNFPSNPKSMFVNNPISYNIMQAFGPRITYTMQESIGNNRLDITTSAQSALLAYAIQPAFGHPYPEVYLDEKYFSPTRDGMTGPLLRSGKILTLNKFRSLKVEFGFHYYINQSWKVGIDYQMDLLCESDQ